jgi:hypothetical protein
LRLVHDTVEAPVIGARTLIVATALALACGGCGGQKRAQAALAWAGKPHVYRAQHLPRDRVVIAQVRNAGTKTLHLVGARLIVRDATGRALAATAAFNTTFAHGLYGALEQPPGGPPVAELARLGKAIYLPAGGSVPFYAAWRLDSRAKEPVRIDWGGGSLAVPRATATAH